MHSLPFCTRMYHSVLYQSNNIIDYKKCWVLKQKVCAWPFVICVFFDYLDYVKSRLLAGLAYKHCNWLWSSHFIMITIGRMKPSTLRTELNCYLTKACSIIAITYPAINSSGITWVTFLAQRVVIITSCTLVALLSSMGRFTVALSCARIACNITTLHTKPLAATVLTAKDGIVTACPLQTKFTVGANSVGRTVTGSSDLITENTAAFLSWKGKESKELTYRLIMAYTVKFIHFWIPLFWHILLFSRIGLCDTK